MNQVISQYVVTSPATPPRLLTREQLAQALQMSVRSLDGLLKTGALPAGLRSGRRLYWDAGVVGAWLKKALAEQHEWMKT